MAKKNAPESRDRIIKTAVVLFAKRGYASIGLRELAEKAEVNLAMVNYFFGGKKKLLMVILDTFFSGYLEILEQELYRDVPFEEKDPNIYPPGRGIYFQQPGVYDRHTGGIAPMMIRISPSTNPNGEKKPWPS